MRNVVIALLAGGLMSGCVSTKESMPPVSSAGGQYESMPVEKIDWQKLNPARGDKSPQAGTLWGDRKGQVPTGFLAKFVDGFSSPAHIHNATYRAVVISGLIHNDDPSAATMWMPAGSFWTQPKGESHITSAKGDDCIALVEIDQGPYLVMSVDEQFDSGERPINVVPDNIVWVESPSEPQTKMAYLWVDLEGENGTFLKLPAGFKGSISTYAPTFRAVVVSGALEHKNENAPLKPGSYVGSTGQFVHHVATPKETVLYIRTEGRYKVVAK